MHDLGRNGTNGYTMKTTDQNNTLTRRDAFRNGLRRLVLVAISVITVVLLRPFRSGRHRAPCVDFLPCGGCPVVAGCSLPQALETRGKLNQEIV